MAFNVKALSSRKLKQWVFRKNPYFCTNVISRLGDRKGGTCTVVWTDVKNGYQQVLLEDYPKQVGVAFSKLFSDHFPSLNKVNLTNLAKLPSNQVLVVGGKPDVHKVILRWIVSCCQGKGLQEFPTYDVERFTKYCMIRENAEILGVTYLIQAMEKRMNEIANVQVHSKDIRALYELLGREHPLVKEIVSKTATLMTNGPKKMKAYNAYVALAQEFKEFGEDIEPIVGTLTEKLERQDNHNLNLAKFDQCGVFGRLRRREVDPTPEDAGVHTVHKNAREKTAVGETDGGQADVERTVIKHKTIHAIKTGHGRLLLPLAGLDVGANGDFFKQPFFVSRASL
jgi:hypothetical protein